VKNISKGECFTPNELLFCEDLVIDFKDSNEFRTMLVDNLLVRDVVGIPKSNSVIFREKDLLSEIQFSEQARAGRVECLGFQICSLLRNSIGFQVGREEFCPCSLIVLVEISNNGTRFYTQLVAGGVVTIKKISIVVKDGDNSKGLKFQEFR